MFKQSLRSLFSILLVFIVLFNLSIPLFSPSGVFAEASPPPSGGPPFRPPRPPSGRPPRLGPVPALPPQEPPSTARSEAGPVASDDADAVDALVDTAPISRYAPRASFRATTTDTLLQPGEAFTVTFRIEAEEDLKEATLKATLPSGVALEAPKLSARAPSSARTSVPQEAAGAAPQGTASPDSGPVASKGGPDESPGVTRAMGSPPSPRGPTPLSGAWPAAETVPVTWTHSLGDIAGD